MGAEHREQLTLEEIIDLRELYGISIAAQLHAAWDLQMISREHYDWWYDEMLRRIDWKKVGEIIVSLRLLEGRRESIQ